MAKTNVRDMEDDLFVTNYTSIKNIYIGVP